MDRLRFLKAEELLRFLHNNKTVMSCMEKPHTFLSQLRDQGLIPEDRYRSASVMKNKEKLKKVVYDILDQFERERADDILLFWESVLDGVIMEQYPTLQKLHSSLMDGSFHFDPQLGRSVERKRKAPSEEEEQKADTGKKKQSAPAPQLIPASSLDKAEGRKPSIFTAQVPVTCGDLHGSLSKDRLAEGRECILFRKAWVTPTEFERLAGRQSCRNWKLSIRCLGRTLGKLMEEGSLNSVKYKGGKKVDEPLHPSDKTTADGDGSEDDDSSYMVFNVLCEDVAFEPAAEPSREELGPAVRLEEQPVGHFEEISEEELTDEQDQELSEDEERKSPGGGSTWGSGVEQPGPWAQLISDSVTKKEKSAAGSLSPQLPVTCGDLQGALFTDRLAKGEKCILFQGQWLIPSEFERQGKKSTKNWKLSIRHNGTPLGKLIQLGGLGSGPTRTRTTTQRHVTVSLLLQDGRLKSVKYKGGAKKADKRLRPSDQRASGRDKPSGRSFQVTCGTLSGTLDKKRFASGACGRSIRTELGWTTPDEFVEEALGKSDGCWEKDIRWNGEPLGVLRENNFLKITCDHGRDEKCKLDKKELDNQKNDDICFVCKSGGELVLCEHCPRSFHQKCHLPHVAKTDLGDDRPWICTFCDFKSYTNCDELDLQAAMSQYVSRHMLRCQYLLLYVCSADKKQRFANPHTLLSDKHKSRGYQTVSDFVSDVHHILTKSQDSTASRLKDLFDGEFRKVFNVCEVDD